jgi:hypothetical protein
MANARASKKMMVRGNSRLLYGVISPGAGGTLSLPIVSAVFSASGNGYSITKTLDAGVEISGATTTAAPYEITIDPEDTASFPDKSTPLTYALTITENDDKVSTVVGGVLVVTPN